MGLAAVASSLVGVTRKLTFRVSRGDFADNLNDTGDATAPVQIPRGFFILGGTFHVITPFETLGGGGSHTSNFFCGPTPAQFDAWSLTGALELYPAGHLQSFHAEDSNQNGHLNTTARDINIRCQTTGGNSLFSEIDQGEVEVSLLFTTHPGI